jgi:energy-dependent translational throttle protein EttA
LKEYKGAVLAVTHDRYFLDNVAGWIVEVDRGRVFPFDGNYTEWLEAKEKRLDLERKKEAMKARQIKTELEWINTTPKARMAKNKARINRYDALLKEAKLRPIEAGQVFIPPGPRLGDIVVRAKNLSKSFEGRVLFDNLNFDIPPGAIVGIVGPNGSGKSTLFNIITGKEEPDSGELVIGDTAKLGFVTQMRELDPENTIYEEVAEGNDYIDVGQQNPVHVRAYLSTFNFKGETQERRLEVCSGGERNRVFLAKMLKSGCNVLMLDEPSNDLDVDTLRSLELALADFPGSALVISHDRWFLDRICTHILAFEGDSQVVFYDGNYSMYELDKVERLGKNAEPRRIKYRRLEKI